MAMNPMQRRARNSFLIGFLVALVIMAVVVFLLLYQIKEIKAAKEKIEALQKTVLVAGSDLKSGATITIDSFQNATVQSTVADDQIVSSTDFEFTNENGDIVEKIDENGYPIQKEMVMKIDVPAGTIVTKDMISEVDDQVTDTQRIQEYNMIVLPSQLANGDYIDIRISLPNGQDYIVLSKKKVLGTTSTSIWLKLNEEELLTLNNAIVESYTITGSKLYAIEFVEAGLQDEAVPTYAVSPAVLTLINTDPNITEEAKQGLWARYNSENRVNYFEPAIAPNVDNQGSLVSAGVASDVEAIKSARQEYVESLEGTEDVGYSR